MLDGDFPNLLMSKGPWQPCIPRRIPSPESCFRSSLSPSPRVEGFIVNEGEKVGKRPSLFYRRMIGMKSSKFHPRYQFAHKGKQSETDATKFQGGTGIEKKRPGVDFFLFWTLGGLTNYVIRHASKYSNITSSTGAFLYAPSQPHQSLVILYLQVQPSSLFKRYLLRVVLDFK